MVNLLLHEHTMECRPFILPATEAIEIVKLKRKNGYLFANADVVLRVLATYTTEDVIVDTIAVIHLFNHGSRFAATVYRTCSGQKCSVLVWNWVRPS